MTESNIDQIANVGLIRQAFPDSSRVLWGLAHLHGKATRQTYDATVALIARVRPDPVAAINRINFAGNIGYADFAIVRQLIEEGMLPRQIVAVVKASPRRRISWPDLCVALIEWEQETRPDPEGGQADN